MGTSDKKLIVLVTVGCVILALLGYAWKHRTIVPFVTVPLERVTTPFAYGSSFFLDHIHTGIAVIDEAITHTKKNDELQSEVAELKQKMADYNEVLAENIRYRQMLQFRDRHPQFDMVAATVVTRDFGTWTNTFTIDRGRAEGITVNMPVVVPGGVVGFVSDVYEHSARVQTLLDPRTDIGVLVQRVASRDAYIVKGDPNVPDTIQMVDIGSKEDVLKGDTLVTSGYGGIYPKGLLVGHVASIQNNEVDGFTKRAVVTPSANFRNIEEVFIIVRSHELKPLAPVNQDVKLVPQTQRDKVEGVKGAVTP